MSSNIHQNISKLLKEKNLTDYKISKDTGVNSSIIVRLRNKNRKISNLRLSTAEKLNNYYLSTVNHK